MSRLPVLLVGGGFAALIVAQVLPGPPPPHFENADLVGSWIPDTVERCGPGTTVALDVTEDGRVAVDAVAYSVSGRLLDTEGIRDAPFSGRTFTVLSLIDATGTRWQFVFDGDKTLTTLDNPFTYRQAPDGEFLALRSLPRLVRCP